MWPVGTQENEHLTLCVQSLWLKVVSSGREYGGGGGLTHLYLLPVLIFITRSIINFITKNWQAFLMRFLKITRLRRMQISMPFHRWMSKIINDLNYWYVGRNSLHISMCLCICTQEKVWKSRYNLTVATTQEWGWGGAFARKFSLFTIRYTPRSSCWLWKVLTSVLRFWPSLHFSSIWLHIIQTSMIEYSTSIGNRNFPVPLLSYSCKK